MQREAIRIYIYYNIYKFNNIYTYRIIYHLLPPSPFSLELKKSGKSTKVPSTKVTNSTKSLVYNQRLLIFVGKLLEPTLMAVIYLKARKAVGGVFSKAYGFVAPRTLYLIFFILSIFLAVACEKELTHYPEIFRQYWQVQR